MQFTAQGTPRAAHRVNPRDLAPHLTMIHDVASRLLAGRADREAYELHDAANAIESMVRAAWARPGRSRGTPNR